MPLSTSILGDVDTYLLAGPWPSNSCLHPKGLSPPAQPTLATGGIFTKHRSDLVIFPLKSFNALFLNHKWIFNALM